MRPTFISTFFLKFLLSVLSLGISMSVLSQEDVNWYTFGGLSLYSEDVDTLVGDGIGYRLGVGFEFNETFGLEFGFDGAATLDPSSFKSAIEEEENVTLLDYDIETQRNFYTSIMGTLSFPLEEKFTLIGKIGYARYSVESKIEIDLAKDDLFYYYDYDLSLKEQGNDPIVSVGMLFPLRGKNSFEFSIAKIFGDAEALSVNGIWRYQF